MKKIRLFCFPYVGTPVPMPNQWKGWRLTSTEQLYSHFHSNSIGARLNVQTRGERLYLKKKKINYLKFKLSQRRLKCFVLM